MPFVVVINELVITVFRNKNWVFGSFFFALSRPKWYIVYPSDKAFHFINLFLTTKLEAAGNNTMIWLRLLGLGGPSAILDLDSLLQPNFLISFLLNSKSSNIFYLQYMKFSNGCWGKVWHVIFYLFFIYINSGLYNNYNILILNLDSLQPELLISFLLNSKSSNIFYLQYMIFSKSGPIWHLIFYIFN